MGMNGPIGFLRMMISLEEGNSDPLAFSLPRSHLITTCDWVIALQGVFLIVFLLSLPLLVI